MRRLALLFLMVLCALPTVAQACRCVSPTDETALETFNNADAVIYGQVQLISQGWNSSGPLATVEVQNVIKGKMAEGDIFIMQYNPVTSACGSILEEGQFYTMGLYNIQNMTTSGRPSVGGYRLMHSCDQYMIQHHLNNIKEMKEK